MIKFDKSLYYYDAEAADFVIEFIEEFCTHVRGDKAGEPLILADFWKEDIIKPVFGIKKRSNNKRRFKTVYIEIGKGNAKSTVGSALALYLLGFDGSKGASVYSIATDTEQARIIFDNAKFMIEQSPYLKQYFEPFMYSIVKKGTPCSYKVLSGDAKGKHGLIPTAIIFDEVHEQRDRELWDTITAGQMKIDDSLTLAFTTAGWDKQTICYELHKKAVEIAEGKVTDDSFYGKIYTAPETDDISDVKTWRKANPGLGTIISVENMAIEYQKVKASPGYENTFRRLHLNQWTDAYESWIPQTEWEKNCSKLKTDLSNAECFAGCDFASTRDFNCTAYIWPIMKPGRKFVNSIMNQETGKVDFNFDYDALEFIEIELDTWIPIDSVEKYTINENINILQWAKEGFIKRIPGSSIDPNYIISDMLLKNEKYGIITCGYDRKFSNFTVKALESHIIMIPVDQTALGMSFPMKTIETLCAMGKLNHRNNPVLSWMIGNTKIYRDTNDNIKPMKSRDTKKIDGTTALSNAMGEWLTYIMNDIEKQRITTIYAIRGVATI